MNISHAKRLVEFDANFSLSDIDETAERRAGVYCIYCAKTHFAYIGATQDCRERIAKHFRRLRFGDHPSGEMQAHFVSHGEANFKAFVIQYCDPEDLYSVEGRWINYFGESRTYNKVGFMKSAQGETKITDLCEMLGVKPDAMRAAWKRNGLKNFDRNRFVTEQEKSAIFEYYDSAKNSLREKAKSGRFAKSVREKKRVLDYPPAPVEDVPPGAGNTRNANNAKSEYFSRAALLNFLLVATVLSHAALIWYDCAVQWGEPGQIGGVMAFIMACAALLIATDPTRTRTSGFALWFVALIDLGAWWVHFPTFQRPGIDDVITGTFAAFLCAASWVALYLYRDYRID